MDASIIKGCAYCGSKKHGTVTCFMDRHPTVTSDDLLNDSNAPVITIKELSYLVSLARKNIVRKKYELEEGGYLVDTCFAEIRKQLNLRKRGRK